MMNQKTTRRAVLLAGLPVAAGAAISLAQETAPPAASSELPRGDATIRGGKADSEIIITTTDRLAGAIHSLTWNGKEFIDSADHGRQLQSASNLDCGGPIKAETFNPTEAGSMSDGAGATSTSRLLHVVAEKKQLQTTTQMAFWLAPGETSGGQPAKNTTRLSNHLLTKRVTIGTKDWPQVLQYDVTFSLPIGEHHTQAVFEVVTGYMPAEFSVFWQLQTKTGKLEPLSDGPGEQANPVILATEDGRHAMGIFSPSLPAGMLGPGYGRFRFAAQRVVKWNCVFRLLNPAGVPAGDYSFRTFIPVGSLEAVRSALSSLFLDSLGGTNQR